MVESSGVALVGRTRVTVWGFLVAAALALAFAWTGVYALPARLLPARLGIFVEPPSALVGLALLVMAAVLALVALIEAARFVKPVIEVVLDDDGVATYGLLGVRRLAWYEIDDMHAQGGVLTFKGPRQGGMRRRVLRVDLGRLDLDADATLAAVRSRRPDLTGRLGIRRA